MTKSFINKHIKRVAVIGAGPGGIAALRALSKEGTFDTITVYERNAQIGGTWIYDSNVDPPPVVPSTDALEVDYTLKVDRLCSPIYANLHTNLPKDLMCFRDAPFSKSLPYFPSHEQVLDYVKSLVVSEGLLPMIKLSTRVDKIDHQDNGWKIVSTNLETGEQSEDKFDAVAVANGHYNVPFIPNIPGIEQLNQNKNIQVMHSRDYRTPDVFKGKTILVIGGGHSALDIVREASGTARKVYQCIRTQTELSQQALERNASNVEQIGLLKEFVHTKDTSIIECEDGKRLNDVDIIVFGTGYLFSYPFLPFQKGNLIQTGQKVHNLLHYMFYKHNPTLCFIGLPMRVVPFPLMQLQSTVMARYWCHKVPMLPFEESAKGTDDKKDFIMSMEQEFHYSDMLSAWSEGWLDRPLEEWQSNDAVTGKLSDKWKYLRENAFKIRKEHLGY
ncbi:hypothetical protein G6F43_011205 [Rhizopus delemar]|nr:hypothetical protein G6F43_011205 [Rhizopus delemar]